MTEQLNVFQINKFSARKSLLANKFKHYSHYNSLLGIESRRLKTQNNKKQRSVLFRKKQAS